MRIAIDGTPASAQLAGIGRYTRELLKALLEQPRDDRYEIICAGSLDAARRLEAMLPPGQWRSIRRLPVSERWLTAAWQRLKLPIPVDLVLDNPDVVHGPDFVLPPTRVASVVTIHDISFLVQPEYAEPSLVEYLTAAVPRTLARADRIICVSASVAAELATAYPNFHDRIVAIPHGVNVTHVDETNAYRSTSAPTILTVGTVEPRKNHLALLEAMPIVRKLNPDARLVIAGRIGWRSEQIVRRIREAVAAGGVEFIEAPPDDKLKSLYRQADVCVYPSYYEGFGLPVLEAMAHGVAVVASDIPVLRETAGDAAAFALPDNPESLAHQIAVMLDDADLRASYVGRGYLRVGEHTWEETARRTRRTYEAAIERHLHG